MNPIPFPDPRPPARTAASTRRLLLTFVLTLPVGGALGLGAGMLGSMWFDPDPTTGIEVPLSADVWTLAMLPLAYWLCVLWHELGHMVGARLGGLRVTMLVAGPLRLDFDADGTRILLNRVIPKRYGLVACVPPSGEVASRGSYASGAAGGPVASLLLAGIAGSAATAIGGWWGGVLFAIAFTSLVFGVGTLMPVHTHGLTTDGGQLLGLARGDDVTRQRLAVAALAAQSATGVRPRDWDPGLLRTIREESGDATLQAYVTMLEASLAGDRGDIDAADTHMRELAEILTGERAGVIMPAIRRTFALALAGWIGQRRREGDSARRWLEAARGGFTDPATVAHAEAAVALAEGDPEAARRHLDTACAALPRLSDRGYAVCLAEQLDELARDLDATPSDPAPALG